MLFPAYSAFGNNEGKVLFDEVLSNAQNCAKVKTGSDFIQCYINATPKKCEKEMMDALATRGDEKSNVRRKLFMCISTCANASFFSRNWGECSRNIK